MSIYDNHYRGKERRLHKEIKETIEAIRMCFNYFDTGDIDSVEATLMEAISDLKAVDETMDWLLEERDAKARDM